MNKRFRLILFFLFSTYLFLAAQLPQSYVCPPCNSSCDTLKFEQSGVCTHCQMELLPLEKNTSEPHQERIAFYLQNGVEVLDFAGPMEVFSYAGYEIFTVSKTKAPIISQGVLKVIPDYSLEDAPAADLLAFFGGNGRSSFGDPQVQNWIKAQTNIDYYFSVCTGAFALAETGLLDGLSATTFHSALDGLEMDFPKVKVVRNARYVDNGKIITTAGISAGIDGALHLVAKLKGFNTARRIAYQMEYDHWTPGDGLLLTKYNPYADSMYIPKLESYSGTYEFYDNQTITIKVNPKDQSLWARVAGMDYPLFYLGVDQFENVSEAGVFFQRNDQGKVTGYTTSVHPAQFLRKLD